MYAKLASLYATRYFWSLLYPLARLLTEGEGRPLGFIGLGNEMTDWVMARFLEASLEFLAEDNYEQLSMKGGRELPLQKELRKSVFHE